jgi:hypothetical protein
VNGGIMPKFKYRRPEMDHAGVYDLESFADDAGDVAISAAEDFHSNHDGWECEWPITFEILDADDISLGCFKVDREAVPHFYITK